MFSTKYDPVLLTLLFYVHINGHRLVSFFKAAGCSQSYITLLSDTGLVSLIQSHDLWKCKYPVRSSNMLEHLCWAVGMMCLNTPYALQYKHGRKLQTDQQVRRPQPHTLTSSLFVFTCPWWRKIQIVLSFLLPLFEVTHTHNSGS